MSLIVENGCVLGYILTFEDKSFSPNGVVHISPEAAAAHNAALAQAEIDGLDTNCEVGQYGAFYLNRKRKEIKTFTGQIVAPSQNVRIHGQVITFTRKNKTFRGRLMKDADCFNFRRIT